MVVYRRILDRQKHLELLEQVRKGVPYKRIAKRFGLAGPSSVYYYRYMEVRPDENNTELPSV